MPKRLARRSLNYNNANNSDSETESERNDTITKEKTSKSTDADGLIADMAKGFLQAQAQIADSSSTSNSQEMIDLLNKLNNQLEKLQNSFDKGTGQQKGTTNTGQAIGLRGNGRQTSTSPLTANNTGQQMQQTESQLSQELQNLFSRLLTENQAQNGQADTQANQKSYTNQAGRENNKSSAAANSVVAQTAAQVLAQAQYELSNELEASLKKLKQVISESEKIANKISSLLGEAGKSK
ncbi:MAG TPA: hypothetical protein PKA28_02055 [Methylomusa anaerophila]|uniref:Uncharacterized protein n=1 Tax=Methylomusa anaerophila TaxID=1930071 RepID=A0A348APF2_9FIRM|nr:hypothetical protein [Methylomusa anaerophila]BBB92950.1 hypothetical protein MAMMFC1_03658 [Methylomusa anaerophila]HML87216.1 hypothetical protein [Methylomusa anaerophila]